MTNYQDYRYDSATADHISAYITKPIESLLDKNRNKKILDIGCGNGWLANGLIAQGYDVYGIDASESGIDIANQTNEGRFFVQNIEENDLPLPIRHIPFDTIISTEVIEHLYSPNTYLMFCKDILAKNGQGEILITTPYHGYLKNVVLALSGKMDAHFTAHWEGGHIKFWSRKTLTESLKNVGLTTTDFIGCGRLPYLWKSMLIKAKI
jgi:2-polyprenyl-3-methyl-5-hydroxy-6-metoxy-1,4-benzoquinol methylase